MPYNDGCIILNGITEASFKVKLKNAPQYKAILESPDAYYDTFGCFIDKMKNDGFIVDDSLDEKQLVEQKYRRMQNPSEYMVMILPTYQCNLRCWYCTQNHKDLWMDAATEALIKKRILKRLNQDDVKSLNVSWFGGEPLLAYDQVLSISEWAKEKAAELGKQYGASITTNGTLLTEERVNKLYEAGIKHYQITIDGDMATHDRIKVLGKTSAFKKTIENIGYIIKHTPCILRFNYTKENMNPDSIVADLDSLLPKEGRERISFMIFKVWQESPDAVPFSEVERLAAAVASIGLTPRLSDIGMCYADKPNFECLFSNGKVGKCDNESPEDREGIITSDGDIQWVGNIAAHAGIMDQKNCECTDCRYVPVCWGPCVAKREKMLNEDGRVKCQFEDKEAFVADMVRNMHLNKEFIKNMSEIHK